MNSKLDEIIAIPGIKIEPKTLAILRNLDELGFEIKKIAPNGSYFEVLNRKEWRGEMLVLGPNPGGEK